MNQSDWGYCYNCEHCHEFEDEDWDNVYFSNDCDECDCDYYDEG